MSVEIPNGVILIWTGTNATIPSGYSRVTSLDDKYIKGWGSENPDTTGGNADHTHNATANHSHTMDNHTHSISIGNVTGGTNDQVDAGGNATDHQGHANSPMTSGAASGGGLSSISSIYSSIANDPPYSTVIFIQSDGTLPFPNGAVALYYGSSVPTNWEHVSALTDKYMKGASSGADAGGTGGSTNNAHNLTHTHTVAGHTHAAVNSGAANRYDQKSSSGSTHIAHSHTHNVDLASTTNTISSTNPPLTTTEVIEPLYKKVFAIKNNTGGDDTQKNIIAMWLGTIYTIPPGWIVCDGTQGTPDLRNYYTKITATAGELGNTGGSNTHTHNDNTHSHSSTGTHNHTANGLTHVGAVASAGGGPNTAQRSDFYHQQSVSSTTATYSTETTSADSASNEPEYRVVSFIQFIGIDQNVTANIQRFNDIQNNWTKGQVVYKQSFDSDTKTNIVHTTPVSTSTRASIRKAFSYKTFEYRISTNSGVHVSVWSKEVLSLPTFSADINGGAGQMTVKLARSYDDFGEDIDVKLFNKVDCYVFDLEAPQGALLYSGYISAYKPVIDGASEYINITLLPYNAQLQEIMLRDGSGNTEIAQNSLDPSAMFRNIIDYCRADGGIINYTASSIDNTNTSVSYTFSAYTIKEALDKAIELTPENWYWYISADNKIYLKETNLTVADHDLIVGKHLNKLETLRRAEDLVNRVYFVGKDTGSGNMYRVYSNNASITAYGIHADKVVDQRVTNTSTADIIANRSLNKKKDPEIRTTAVILDSNGPDIKYGYDIESIRPGHSIRLKNLRQATKTITLWDQSEWDVDVWDQTLAYAAADVIQVQSISYHPNYLTIETSSRLPEISKRMEDIYRNLEETETENVPSSPTVA